MRAYTAGRLIRGCAEPGRPSTAAHRHTQRAPDAWGLFYHAWYSSSLFFTHHAHALSSNFFYCLLPCDAIAWVEAIPVAARIRLIIWICSWFPTRMLKEIIAGLGGVLKEHERERTTKDRHEKP